MATLEDGSNPTGVGYMTPTFAHLNPWKRPDYYMGQTTPVLPGVFPF